MVPVIFLAGLGRSGSTLIERALGEVPGVQSLGEVVHLWHRGLVDDELCGCGRPFSACPFWSAVGQRAFGGWENVDPPRVAVLRRRCDRLRRIPQLLRGPRGRLARSVTELAWHHRRVYEAAAEVGGAAIVVDSSKHPSLAYCLAASGAVQLRVVHVVRDSRGVAYSWGKRVPRPEARASTGERHMERYPPPRAAALWSVHNACVPALARLGTPVMLLRYESFVEDPAAALAAVIRFAGGSPDALNLDFATPERLTLRPAHTVSGNPVRLRTGVVPLRHDDEWRRRLPLRDRVVVTALSGPGLYRYGYLRSPAEARR